MEKEKIDANDILQLEGGDKVLFAEIQKAKTVAEKATAATSEKEKAETKLEISAEVMNKILYLHRNDSDNAQRINLAFGGVIRYNIDAERWGFFNDGKWEFISSSNSALYPFAEKIGACLEKSLKSVISEQKTLAADANYTTAETKDKKIALLSNLLSDWKKAKTRKNAIELLKGKENILIRQSDLDKSPMLLNVKNGVIDLETGKFYPAAPEMLLTKQANVIYNPDAKAPLFEKFLAQVLPDETTRAAMLRYLGYCLSGSVNEEKFLFVVGEGGNGKGTLFKTIEHLLGDYATTFNIETLLKQKNPSNAQSATPELAKLYKKRLAIAPEIPAGRELNLALLKDLTGGDTITARPLYSPPIEFEPAHKFIFSGQYLPKIDNVRDKGFLRRLIVVKFPVQIEGDQVNPKLKGELKKESSGILNILLAECLKYQREGLIISGDMQETREEYLNENDFVKNFIDENCIIEIGASIIRKDFLERLKKDYPIALKFTDSKLTEMIEAVDKNIVYKKSNGKRQFFGLKFSESE